MHNILAIMNVMNCRELLKKKELLIVSIYNSQTSSFIDYFAPQKERCQPCLFSFNRAGRNQETHVLRADQAGRHIKTEKYRFGVVNKAIIW
jgi:hypothetical protein